MCLAILVCRRLLVPRGSTRAFAAHARAATYEDLQVAVDANPSEPRAHFALGMALAQQQSHKDAAACFKRAIELQPSKAASHYFLGRMQSAMGDGFQAEKSYRRAVALNPRHALAAECHFGLASLLMRRGELASAEQSFTKVVESGSSDSRFMMAHYNLAVICGMGGRLHEASAHLEQVMQHAPELFLDIYWPKMSEVRERAQREADSMHRILSGIGSRDVAWEQHVISFSAALRDIRCLSWTSQWLAKRQLESYRVFGGSANSAAYGLTYLDDAMAILSHALTRAAISTGKCMVVIGSGLGCLCHFAATVLKVPCVGYDLLPDACVAEARHIQESHSMSQTAVEFRHENGLVADVSSAGICWMHDYTFPHAVRMQLLTKLAEELPVGAVVVTYRPMPESVAGFDLGDVVAADVTWRTQHLHYMLVKNSISLAE